MLFGILLDNFLIRQVPVIEVPSASGEIGREPQPGNVRGHAPASYPIDRSPEVRQIRTDAKETDDVDGGFDGTLGDEEKGHPDKIQAQLDGVQCGAVLCHPGLLNGS